MDDLGNKPHPQLNVFDAHYTGIGFFCLLLLEPALEGTVRSHSCVILLSDPRGVSLSMFTSVKCNKATWTSALLSHPLFPSMPQLAHWHCACECGAMCRLQWVPRAGGAVFPPCAFLLFPAGAGAAIRPWCPRSWLQQCVQHGGVTNHPQIALSRMLLATLHTTKGGLYRNRHHGAPVSSGCCCSMLLTEYHLQMRDEFSKNKWFV